MSISRAPSSSLPDFIFARRRALGLSVAELAEGCALSREAVGRLEQGRFLPSPSQAYQLALVLGVDPVGLGRWATTELLFHPEFLVEHVLPAADIYL